MCLTLFGRRKAPPLEQLPPSLRNQPFRTTESIVAFAVAFLLSGLTGFCEESVFRRIVPSVIGQWVPSVPIAFGLQALLFALGHVQPGSTSKRENQVLIGLQLWNGIGFGLLYLVTDLPTCMICHTVYDTL
jgi:membrane protease YdiL (CAAX protease family)